MRGKLHNDVLNAIKNGLIPACAGKTAPTVSAGNAGRAHPRVCGENNSNNHVVDPDLGSSPRVRGKRYVMRHNMFPKGLIPACAGKTQLPISLSTGRRAHPRVCGENEPAGRVGAGGEGSSPRVRGKREGFEVNGVIVGLIPACAGKTIFGVLVQGLVPAHPRVCGENLTCRGAGSSVSGSSPRVRGKHRRRRTGRRRLGLIPACAGKTDRRQKQGDNH